MKIRIHPLPYATDIAFAIRDDDLSFFTPPEKLEQIYKNAWNMGFKLSFAAIPKHKGVNKLNVPPEFRGTNEYYPIYENEDLVEYLKSKICEGKADIIQHGFCHAEDTNLPTPKFDYEKGIISNSNNQKMNLVKSSEFYGIKKEETYFKVGKGKSVLEKTFDIPIKVFAAPQELLTRDLWMALWKNNLNYCGNIGRNIISQVPISRINFYALLKAATKKILRINQESIARDIMHITDITTIPATYRHYWNKFRDDELSEYWFNHFKTIFQSKKKQNGYFILLTHHWEYFYDWEEEITQARQHQYLYKILEHVSSEPYLWNCSLNKLASWIIAKKNLVVTEKRSEARIFSPYPIRGLSIPADQIDTRHLDEEIAQVKKKGDKDFISLDIEAGEHVTLPVKK